MRKTLTDDIKDIAIRVLLWLVTVGFVFIVAGVWSQCAGEALGATRTITLSGLTDGDGVPVADGVILIAEHAPYPTSKCAVSNQVCVFSVTVSNDPASWSITWRKDGTAPINNQFFSWREIDMGQHKTRAVRHR